MDPLNTEFHFDRPDPWQLPRQQDAIQQSQAAEQEAAAAGHLLALLAQIATGDQNLQAATKPEAAAFRSQQEAEGTTLWHPPPPRFHPAAARFGNAAGQGAGVPAHGLSGRDPRLANLATAPAAIHPPPEQLAHQQLATGAWMRQAPAKPKLNLAGAASNGAGLLPGVPDRIRSRLHPVPGTPVPLSGRDPRLPAGTQLTGCFNPGDAASSHAWLPKLPPDGHRFYSSQLLSAPAQQQASSALPHRADNSLAVGPRPTNAPGQLFTTHVDPQAHAPAFARGNSSFTDTRLSFSDCEQPGRSTSSKGSPLNFGQDVEPQMSAWKPQVVLEPGLGELAGQRGSARRSEGSGTDRSALQAVAVAISLVDAIPEWPLEGPTAELPATGLPGPFNAPGTASSPTDTQLLRRILHRETQAVLPEPAQPVPEDRSLPQASELPWLAEVVAAHDILSLASAGQQGLTGPHPEPAQQAARPREHTSTSTPGLTAARQLRPGPPQTRPSKPGSALPAPGAKRRTGPAHWRTDALQGRRELTPARQPCKPTKRSRKRSWSVQLEDADWRAGGRGRCAATAEWDAPTTELPQAKRRKRTAKEELRAASSHGQSYRCPVCDTGETPLWRWEGDLLVCNACGLRRRQGSRRRSSRGRKKSANKKRNKGAVPVATTLPADGLLPASHGPLEDGIRHTRQPSRPTHASRPAHHARQLLSNNKDWHINGSDSPSSESSDSGARGFPDAGPGPTQMAPAANLGSGSEIGSRASSMRVWPRWPDKHRNGGSTADRTASPACSGDQEAADKLRLAHPGISLVWGLRRKRSFWI